MPKIIHYRKQCIGCNSCSEDAPDYWEIDNNDGKANLKRGQEKKKDVYVLDISDAELEPNKKAASHCPMAIIEIRDDKGKKIE